MRAGCILLRVRPRSWQIWTGRWILWFNCLEQVVYGGRAFGMSAGIPVSPKRKKIFIGNVKYARLCQYFGTWRSTLLLSVAACCFIPEWFRRFGGIFIFLAKQVTLWFNKYLFQHLENPLGCQTTVGIITQKELFSSDKFHTGNLYLV